MDRRAGSWSWYHQYLIGSKMPRSRRRMGVFYPVPRSGGYEVFCLLGLIIPSSTIPGCFKDLAFVQVYGNTTNAEMIGNY